MRHIDIRDKLKEIDYSLDQLALGDFDQIGEFTAKKDRHPGSELYKRVGCFFRPNYERGILLYALIQTFKIESVLEIGTGRCYASFCMAKAMCDAGIDGKITTVDRDMKEDYLKQLAQVFPQEWFSKIEFINGTSEEYFKRLEESQKFDLIFIDGDHMYDAVKSDWENSRDKYNKFLLFDDYHLPGEEDPNIQCARVIDQIEDDTKELIIMDRRIFLDDRRIADEDIRYGQVLLTNKEFNPSDFIVDW